MNSLFKCTLGIVKGPTIARGQLGPILTDIARRGFTLYDVRRIDFTPETLREFYPEHVGRPYWNNIEKVMMMPCGCVAFIAHTHPLTMGDGTENGVNLDPIPRLRAALGESSNPAECSPNTIRGKWAGIHFGAGPSIYADNALHASDSTLSYIRESKIVSRL